MTIQDKLIIASMPDIILLIAGLFIWFRIRGKLKDKTIRKMYIKKALKLYFSGFLAITGGCSFFFLRKPKHKFDSVIEHVDYVLKNVVVGFGIVLGIVFSLSFIKFYRNFKKTSAVDLSSNPEKHLDY